VSEDRNEYMRVYMQDRRTATKLGLDIKEYRNLLNAGNLPDSQQTTRTYTKRAATTNSNTTPIWALDFDTMPVVAIYASIGLVVVLFFGICFAISFVANRQAKRNNEDDNSKE
jgi:hypothetical protein